MIMSENEDPHVWKISNTCFINDGIGSWKMTFIYSNITTPTIKNNARIKKDFYI